MPFHNADPSAVTFDIASSNGIDLVISLLCFPPSGESCIISAPYTSENHPLLRYAKIECSIRRPIRPPEVPSGRIHGYVNGVSQSVG